MNSKNKIIKIDEYNNNNQNCHICNKKDDNKKIGKEEQKTNVLLED